MHHNRNQTKLQTKGDFTNTPSLQMFIQTYTQQTDTPTLLILNDIFNPTRNVHEHEMTVIIILMIATQTLLRKLILITKQRCTCSCPNTF